MVIALGGLRILRDGARLAHLAPAIVRAAFAVRLASTQRRSLSAGERERSEVDVVNRLLRAQAALRKNKADCH